MINTNSPIIQNIMDNRGTNNQITEQQAASMADFSNTYRTPALCGYSVQPQQFGTLGYNPQNNFNSSIQSFNPQISYNPGAIPQYNNRQQQLYSDQYYTIPGYNPYNSDMMYTSDFEQRQLEINKKMKAEMENNNNVYNNNGYYNFNYINPYVSLKYKNLQLELDKEAKQRRINFNKKMSSIAHTNLDGEPPSEEYLNSIYDDTVITIPSQDVEIYKSIDKLSRYTVDINKIEADHFNNCNAQVTSEHNKIIDPNSSLKEFLENAGELYALGIQDEVIKAKKDKSNMYDNSDNYRRYLLQQIERRDGVMSNTMFPNLMNPSNNILDDGTVKINLPDWLSKKDTMSENKYAESKQKFINDIYHPRG